MRKIFVIFLLLLSIWGYYYLFMKDPTQQYTKETEMIPLYFESVTVESDIQKLSSSEINEILKEVPISKSKIFIYTKNNDQEFLYGGFSTKDSLYDLGKIGMFIYIDVTSISIRKGLDEKTVVRIDSALGANYPQSNYFLLEDTLPKKILTIDGHAEEVDLDQDGTVEIISSIGTPTETLIYKRIGNQFAVTNINASLEALSVHFILQDDLVFQAYYHHDKTTRTYIFTEDGLLRITSNSQLENLLLNVNIFYYLFYRFMNYTTMMYFFYCG